MSAGLQLFDEFGRTLFQDEVVPQELEVAGLALELFFEVRVLLGGLHGHGLEFGEGAAGVVGVVGEQGLERAEAEHGDEVEAEGGDEADLEGVNFDSSLDHASEPLGEGEGHLRQEHAREEGRDPADLQHRRRHHHDLPLEVAEHAVLPRHHRPQVWPRHSLPLLPQEPPAPPEKVLPHPERVLAQPAVEGLQSVHPAEQGPMRVGEGRRLLTDLFAASPGVEPREQVAPGGCDQQTGQDDGEEDPVPDALVELQQHCE